MTKQATNNGYTRCSECAEVYDVSMKSCPKCGKANPAYSVSENKLSQDYDGLLDESLGLVFNIID
nr:MAG TPA: DNA-directed RNA polymerase [Caudoviricetes sp.]